MPESLWSATFYPEAGAPAYVGEALSAGAEVFKVHLQVGEFHLDDPLLDQVWGVLADAGTPVVCTPAPARSATTSPGRRRRRRLLARFPRLALVVAHLGAPECEEFLDARRDPRARPPRHHDGVHRLLRRLPAAPAAATARPRRQGAARQRLPHIPYPYAHQLEGLARLDLGDDWLRDVCWNNGVRLFGEP